MCWNPTVWRRDEQISDYQVSFIHSFKYSQHIHSSSLATTPPSPYLYPFLRHLSFLAISPPRAFTSTLKASDVLNDLFFHLSASSSFFSPPKDDGCNERRLVLDLQQANNSEFLTALSSIYSFQRSYTSFAAERKGVLLADVQDARCRERGCLHGGV